MRPRALYRNHLAWVRPEIAEALLAGQKRVESRLSRYEHPAAIVRPGDLIAFRSGAIFGVSWVDAVASYHDVLLDVDTLWARYQDHLGPGALDYFERHQDAQHAVFITLHDLVPVEVAKDTLPKSRLGWISDWRPGQLEGRTLIEALHAHQRRPSVVSGRV